MVSGNGRDRRLRLCRCVSRDGINSRSRAPTWRCLAHGDDGSFSWRWSSRLSRALHTLENAKPAARNPKPPRRLTASVGGDPQTELPPGPSAAVHCRGSTLPPQTRDRPPVPDRRTTPEHLAPAQHELQHRQRTALTTNTRPSRPRRTEEPPCANRQITAPKSSGSATLWPTADTPVCRGTHSQLINHRPSPDPMRMRHLLCPKVEVIPNSW
jgi:hypothetical protein